MIPRTQFVVAVTRGRKTRFFWGVKLKDALALANLRDNERFEYAKFARGAMTKAVLTYGGTVISQAA